MIDTESFLPNWWGYLHVNSKTMTKAYYNNDASIEDASTSPFVKAIHFPFYADTRDEAEEYLKRYFIKKGLRVHGMKLKIFNKK